jgi:DNA-binding HxlR family transcriptional regulator
MASAIKESSTNIYNLRVLADSCEVNEILERIGKRWKMQILFSISKEVNQFSLLKKAFPSLSDQVLGKRLGELVTEGLAEKIMVENTCPYQIIYSTTEKSNALLEIVRNLHQWGKMDWEK